MDGIAQVLLAAILGDHRPGTADWSGLSHGATGLIKAGARAVVRQHGFRERARMKQSKRAKIIESRRIGACRVLIQWCLKGIPQIAPVPGGAAGFGDAEAAAVLASGLSSNWLRNAAGNALLPGLPDAHRALGDTALDNHVNNYGAVGHTTPYISLSAGVVTPAPRFGGVSVKPAWQTAVDFATRGGTTTGYIFRCWCVVAPKPAPGLPGLADQVRDLNIFRRYCIFHSEGEIAANILVPHRQIERVHKLGSNLHPLDFAHGQGLGSRIDNLEFVKPDDISNVLEVVS